MPELVVHYTFGDGTATDRSGFGNHGRVLGPRLASGPMRSALEFDGIDDRVVAPPSPSLSHLGGVRALAAARLASGGARRTLIEGYLAFSLVVEADGSLSGFVYTDNAWRGLTSAPGTIWPGRWFLAEFLYDGRDTLLLAVDDVAVADRSHNAGRVGSVAWPFGLTVGAWPDGDRRCFAGEIAAVQLWRATPTTEPA